MKSKVKFSAYCTVITATVLIALAAAIIACRDVASNFVPLVAIAAAMIATGLFYCPLSIEATDSTLIIRRPLKSTIIPYSAIASADRCIPSAGGMRLCGSGGFLGYWGHFSDIIIGTYFGYYGNHNQCILLRLRCGRQYVISCADPDRMLAAISGNLQ